MANKNYNEYASADTPELRAFLCSAFSYAKQLYGQPRTPVNKVYLCWGDKPLVSKVSPDYRPLTEINDEKKGWFTIYLNSAKCRPAIYGALAHEAAHLLNARLFDCYVEGLNHVFADKLLSRKGFARDWNYIWGPFFAKRRKGFYGATYFMMKDVCDVAGEHAMKGFLAHARYAGSGMYIHAPSWIASLPAAIAGRVRRMILGHEQNVNDARVKEVRKTKVRWAFRVPA